jgi:hypothetical protein
MESTAKLNELGSLPAMCDACSLMYGNTSSSAGCCSTCPLSDLSFQYERLVVDKAAFLCLQLTVLPAIVYVFRACPAKSLPCACQN